MTQKEIDAIARKLSRDPKVKRSIANMQRLLAEGGVTKMTISSEDQTVTLYPKHKKN